MNAEDRLDAEGSDDGARRSSARPWGLTSGKGFACGFGILLIGATLSPITENWREKPKDNFPLSYYPMFSAKRSDEGEVTYFKGIDARGNSCRIPYSFAGTGGLNQVRRQIRKVVGRGKAEQLCQSVAARVGARKGAPLADVRTVQVVTGRYRLSSYFSGDKTPVSEVIHATVAVERGQP